MLGLAKQTAKGTPVTTDTDFTYLLFREGNVGVQPMYLPLDMEVGGGAVMRNILKVGVASGGELSLIPRPKSLGYFFHGITGSVTSVDGTDGSYSHTFQLGADQFSAPWYTLRNSPGALLGEQLSDVRVAGLSLAWRGGRFVEGQASFQGIGVPANVSTAAWNYAPKVDGGPQFLAPLGSIALPTGTSVSVVAGTFTAGLSMPIDEQMVVGSYSPQNLSVTQRAYALSLMIKIDDATLYKKIMYDPAGGSSWVASILREANFTLSFASDQLAAVGKPYSFSIAANGASGSGANVAWSCQPLGIKAGRQIMLAATGTFLADPA
jgi:hypothetical protein